MSKQKVVSAGTAFFIFSFQFVFAIAFLAGSLFIYYSVYNPVYDRPYSAGDVLATFFGVIFGMFALGVLGPNMEAIAGAKAAA